jgi:hypothetical protein
VGSDSRCLAISPTLLEDGLAGAAGVVLTSGDGFFFFFISSFIEVSNIA